MSINTKYTCPCCGFKVFDSEPGSFDICPICFWEDEAMQLRYPNERGANRVSLIEAQLNYEELGYADIVSKELVRKPGKEDIKDENWRKIDIKTDNIENKNSESECTTVYPEDLTKLYYWEENYWLK